MISAQGNLVIIGVNTANPQVFLGGVATAGIRDIRIDWDADDPRVKIKLAVGLNTIDHVEALRAAGVIVKEV